MALPRGFERLAVASYKASIHLGWVRIVIHVEMALAIKSSPKPEAACVRAVFRVGRSTIFSSSMLFKPKMVPERSVINKINSLESLLAFGSSSLIDLGNYCFDIFSQADFHFKNRKTIPQPLQINGFEYV